MENDFCCDILVPGTGTLKIYEKTGIVSSAERHTNTIHHVHTTSESSYISSEVRDREYLTVKFDDNSVVSYMLNRHFLVNNGDSITVYFTNDSTGIIEPIFFINNTSCRFVGGWSKESHVLIYMISMWLFRGRIGKINYAVLIVLFLIPACFTPGIYIFGYIGVIAIFGIAIFAPKLQARKRRKFINTAWEQIKPYALKITKCNQLSVGI